jgi:hypothetical protein
MARLPSPPALRTTAFRGGRFAYLRRDRRLARRHNAGMCTSLHISLGFGVERNLVQTTCLNTTPQAGGLIHGQTSTTGLSRINPTARGRRGGRPGQPVRQELDAPPYTIILYREKNLSCCERLSEGRVRVVPSRRQTCLRAQRNPRARIHKPEARARDSRPLEKRPFPSLARRAWATLAGLKGRPDESPGQAWGRARVPQHRLGLRSRKSSPSPGRGGGKLRQTSTRRHFMSQPAPIPSPF